MKRLFIPLLALGLLCLVGCSTPGNIIMVIPILDGKSVNVTLTPKGPKNAEDDDVRILFANFTIEDDKQVKYTFIFEMLSKAVPKKIVVEAVNEAPPELLLEDNAPKLLDGKGWEGKSQIQGDMATNMAWLNHDTNTMRIYRFTITYADGHKSELFQATTVPAFIKPILKERMGIPIPRQN